MDYVCVKPINVSITNRGHGNASRTELIQWLRETQGEQIEKIEDMSTGVTYCIMLNQLFRDSIAMNKIKLNPQHPHEKQFNFKQLQYAFHMLGIEKQINIEKLARGKFQDNFEFLQWFRKFHMVNFKNIKKISKSERDIKKSRSQKSLHKEHYSKKLSFKRSRTAPAMKEGKSALDMLELNNIENESVDGGNTEYNTVSELANDLEQFELDVASTENEFERKILERRIYHQILGRIETLLRVQIERYEILQKAFDVLSNMKPNSSIYDMNTFIDNLPLMCDNEIG